jgi:hypothetical protein
MRRMMMMSMELFGGVDEQEFFELQPLEVNEHYRDKISQM